RGRPRAGCWGPPGEASRNRIRGAREIQGRATVLHVALFSRRLPHVITRADMARTLAPTYAKAAQVDAEEAEDRLLRAVENQRILDELYGGLAAALADAQGPL